MNARELKTIAKVANQMKENENGYNFAPLRYFEKCIFKSGNTTRKDFNFYYQHVKDFADAKTFFMSQFVNFDIFVWCESLYYSMSQAFPEITTAIINEWIDENRKPHHIIRNRI